MTCKDCGEPTIGCAGKCRACKAKHRKAVRAAESERKARERESQRNYEAQYAYACGYQD